MFKQALSERFVPGRNDVPRGGKISIEGPTRDASNADNVLNCRVVDAAIEKQ